MCYFHDCASVLSFFTVNFVTSYVLGMIAKICFLNATEIYGQRVCVEQQQI